jgi:hypothetical protein
MSSWHWRWHWSSTAYSPLAGLSHEPVLLSGQMTHGKTPPTSQSSSKNKMIQQMVIMMKSEEDCDPAGFWEQS